MHADHLNPYPLETAPQLNIRLGHFAAAKEEPIYRKTLIARLNEGALHCAKVEAAKSENRGLWDESIAALPHAAISTQIRNWEGPIVRCGLADEAAQDANWTRTLAKIEEMIVDEAKALRPKRRRHGAQNQAAIEAMEAPAGKFLDVDRPFTQLLEDSELLHAFQSLSPVQRQAYALRAHEGWTFERMESLFGEPAKTWESRYYEAWEEMDKAYHRQNRD